MDVKVPSGLPNTLSCLDVRSIQNVRERADLIQLFVFLSNLAEKCVIVKASAATYAVDLHLQLHLSFRYQ